MSRNKRFSALVLATLLAGASSQAAEPRLDVLIVDGQNNHNWRATTPVLRKILEGVDHFKVDVATTPAKVAEFAPDWKKYDVVVSNYNGADWSKTTQEAFADFVRSGGGLVSVHAADNSFPKWKEYNEMIGVGGWGGRDEKDGPMIYWENGKYVRDTSRGRGGSHGRQHAFQVVLRDREHPITRGLPEKWMHAADELYTNLRGPAKNMKVLATALAAKNTGGTGRHEPQLMVISFGKGRVFHSTMGHHAGAMKCAGFAFTLQRGTEWAATGKVTLDKVPATFPTADSVKQWREKTSFKSIRTYDFGQDRTALAAIEELCRGASPSSLAKVEAELLAALAAPETKYAGRQFVVRLLRRIGSARCVPALEKLLQDEKLSHNARWALQRLPGPEATQALRRAMSRTRGDLKIGVVGSLGGRGDRSVVPDLAGLLGSSHAELSLAAIKALRRIGGKEAAAALTAASRIHPDHHRARDNAILACADAMARDGDGKGAARLYQLISSSPRSDAVLRLAGYRGSLRTDGARAALPLIQLLSSPDQTLSGGARKLLRDTAGADITQKIAGTATESEPDLQVELLSVLVGRKDSSASAACLQLTRSKSPRVRLAAIAALGSVGDARVVRALSSLATRDSDEGKAAFESLTTLSGEGVVASVVRLTGEKDLEQRVLGVRLLHARHESSAGTALITAAQDAHADVRVVAADALASIGGPVEFPFVAAIAAKSETADERQRFARALLPIADRLDDRVRGPASELLSSVIESSSAEVQVALLPTTAVLSTKEGLACARKLLVPGANPDVSRAALQTLSAWRTPDPLGDLLSVARSAGSAELRSIALGGYTRLLSLPANRPAMETAAFLDEAVTLAQSSDEKSRIIAKLAEFPCKESLAIAEKHAEVAALKAAALGAAQKIRGVLIQNSLVATSSHNQGETNKAFDKSQSSRWSTNTPMKPGMWFQVDLGAEQAVTRLILDSRDSPGDYPRGCEVYTSFNGKDWGKPVLKSPPQRPITRLVFPKPVRARFVKIVQTGETQGLFWSIHNLRIDFE